MCGIFAYIGNRQAVNLLIAALKRLEYRGYDSAGVGIHGEPLKVRKKVGKVACLEDECASGKLEGTCGIAHTRWATHGKPSDSNSHPHTSTDRSIAVVHNGVIENYRALKEQLSSKGYVFVSETDTELLAHLVQDLHQQVPAASWSQVVALALQLVEGAYGVVFLFQDEPDLLIGARKGSPLILGVGSGEYMLASDASAIVEHTQDVVYIGDGEMVEISRNRYKIQACEAVVKAMADSDGASGTLSPKSPTNPIVRLEMSLEQIE
jgi:glucosamine--fructose-6-phosphate aminotransferase (isomerizing)